MISLGTLRYRSAIADFGGPVERLAVNRVNVRGKSWALVNAYLPRSIFQLPVTLHSDAAGTGVDPVPLLARMKAISEAFERWAYYALVRSPQGWLYGFKEDASTTGMAAFPGIFAAQTRHFSLAEAWERYILASWWDGRCDLLPAHSTQPGIDAWALQPRGCPVVFTLLCRREPENFFTYGFAAARTFEKSETKALIELERMRMVVLPHWQQHPELDLDALRVMPDVYERRLLFYAYPSGQALFRRRLASKAKHAWVQPRALFDGPVHGPWDAYTHVWRVVFDIHPLPCLSHDGFHTFFW